jgi:hypothetical protein
VCGSRCPQPRNPVDLMPEVHAAGVSGKEAVSTVNESTQGWSFKIKIILPGREPEALLKRQQCASPSLHRCPRM